MKRRKFLKFGGLAGLSLVSGDLLASCGDKSPSASEPTIVTTTAISPTSSPSAYNPKVLASFTNPLRTPTAGAGGIMGVIDVRGDQALSLSTKPTQLQLLAGSKTPFLSYQTSQNGMTYYNPLFRVQQGQTFTANFVNGLNDETTIHWHGLLLDWKMDGNPASTVKAGGTYQYTFEVKNRGGTYWYHPHPHKFTASQTYQGLSGFFIVEDADTQRLNQTLDLKLGETDLPILIQDKRLDSRSQLVYPTDSESQSMGAYGDVILTNLVPNASLNVSNRIYRFRLLNGSNARTYRLAFVKDKINQKVPYWLIGTDGGLLDKPYQVSEVFLSAGERVDVLLDLKKYITGDVLALKSLVFDPAHNEMAGMNMSGAGAEATATPSNIGGMSGMPGMGDTGNSSNTTPVSSLDDGQEFFVLKLVVKEQQSYDRTIPTNLSELTPLPPNSPASRQLTLSQGMAMPQGQPMQMQWLINGKSYNIEDFSLVVKRGSSETWEFRNVQQSMPHPMHLHGFQFRVVQRLNSPNQLKGLATYDNGRLATDLGWKDTVLVWPGETVKIGLDFTHNFTGEQNYLVHCHVLEHEDNGMMLNYRVV